MKAYRGRRAIFHVLTAWLITAVALRLLSTLIPGYDVESWKAAIWGAAWIGILNALLWPLLIRFALPITVLTLGFAAILLNGVIVWLASRFVDGFNVETVWAGIIVAIWITIVTTIVTTLFGIDDDDFYYRNVVKRAAKRGGAIASDVPGIFFLEIDGLGHDVLQRAIRNGDAPTMSRWLHDGSHRLITWETDWSSQTGASQTGLLHGSNEGIVAFRWWEKDRGVAVASSSIKDVMAIEQRLSNGEGILHSDGASRANMYSGDAPHSLLTISTVLRRDRHEGRLGGDYYAYFANPYNLARTFILVIAEIVRELWQANQQKRLDIQPRVHRGLFPYPLMRAWMSIVQRDLQVQALIGDVYAGRPVAYTTFSGYDEVAHHSGIERRETLDVLRRLDRQFARIATAAEEAPRPYRFVVLSDHGQSQGATFKQRYETTLEELVKAECASDDLEATTQSDEGWTYLSAAATEAARGAGFLGKTVRGLTRKKHVGDAVVLGEHERERQAHEDARKAIPEVVAMASGCLGLVYFPREPGRLTLERLNEIHPTVIPTLRDHPGIGFLLVRSEKDGAVVLGANGTNYLDQDRVEGEDPLAPFGPNAAAHVRRTDGFEHCGDIMVNSTYWDEADEVAAFEELCGSHGGMGGEQAYAFVLVPPDFDLPDDMIVGAEEMHRWMRRWLADAGQDGYAESDRVASLVTGDHETRTDARDDLVER